MIALFLSLLTAPADAGKRSPTPEVVENAVEFAAVDRAKAISLLEDALEAGTDKRNRGVIALHAGEQRRLNGDTGRARAWYEEAIREDAGGVTSDAAAIGLTLLSSSGGMDAQGVADLRRVSEKTLLDTQNADRFLLLAVDAARMGQPGKVGAHAKKALAYAEADPAQRARIADSLKRLASGDTEVSADTEAGTGSLLERARNALEKGDRARAAELARKAESEAAPDSFEALSAMYMVKRAESTVAVDSRRIAVLLPLSGKYEAVGRQVTQAIEFGYRAGGGTAPLDFVDTMATPEGAVAALEKAVLQDGAVAVMGPLLSDSTEPVVQAAAALEVPLISLSQANESDEHEWIFQGVPSIGDQVGALVEHVMVTEGRKRFAIFAPDTAYGKRAASQFRTRVEERDGAIAIEIFYDPKAPALMEFAAQLGQKDNKARASELYALRRRAEANGRDTSSVVLPPKADFDGIFIPDNARKVPIAAAALAYEEFGIGKFRPRYDEEPVPLLGLSGWNNGDVAGAGGEYVRDSRFTDAFFVPDEGAFSSAYKSEFSRTPSSLEAVTVDAARLVGQVSSRTPATRMDFKTALAEVQVTDAPTGASGFDAERRRVQSEIRILTIDRIGILPVGRERAPDPED